MENIDFIWSDTETKIRIGCRNEGPGSCKEGMFLREMEQTLTEKQTDDRQTGMRKFKFTLSTRLQLQTRNSMCMHTCFVGEQKQRMEWKCLWVWHGEGRSRVKHLHVWWDMWPPLLTPGLWRVLSNSIPSLSLCYSRRLSATCKVTFTWPTATAEVFRRL